VSGNPEQTGTGGGGAGNVLLQEVEYKITRTARGTWREHMYPTGATFREYRSRARFLGRPVVHVTYGRCPSTGRRVTAYGVVAVGRRAVGGLAIGQLALGIVPVGQLAIGLVAFGQAALGLLFGFGQLGTGVLALAQLGIGYVTVAQLGVGRYVLAQLGVGEFVLAMNRQDPEVLEMLRRLLGLLGIGGG